jgi:hypothetical protein
VRGEARRGKKNRRDHYRLDGSPKMPMRSWQAARREAARLSAAEGKIIVPYKCPMCDAFHVGSVSEERQLAHSRRPDLVEELESGSRVAHATAQESAGTVAQRLRYFKRLALARHRKRGQVSSSAVTNRAGSLTS